VRADFTHKNPTTAAEGDKPRKVIDKKKTTRRIGKMQRCVQLSFSDSDS